MLHLLDLQLFFFLIYFAFESTFQLRKTIEMEAKTFNVVTLIAMALTITVAVLSIVGTAITGFYPGIVVLFIVALIPICSRAYIKNQISQSSDFERPKYTPFTIINLLSILVVMWMTFVILVDRVFSKVL